METSFQYVGGQQQTGQQVVGCRALTKMGRRSRCLLSVLLACSTIIIKADENVISINTLLSERSSYLVIDFQSDYQRELNGYIAGSILVSKQEEDVVGFIKKYVICAHHLVRL